MSGIVPVRRYADVVSRGGTKAGGGQWGQGKSWGWSVGAGQRLRVVGGGGAKAGGGQWEQGKGWGWSVWAGKGWGWSKTPNQPTHAAHLPVIPCHHVCLFSLTPAHRCHTLDPDPTPFHVHSFTCYHIPPCCFSSPWLLSSWQKASPLSPPPIPCQATPLQSLTTSVSLKQYLLFLSVLTCIRFPKSILIIYTVILCLVVMVMTHLYMLPSEHYLNDFLLTIHLPSFSKASVHRVLFRATDHSERCIFL